MLLGIVNINASMFPNINYDNTDIIEHHYYNVDIIYYKNSLNQSVWVSKDDFIEYFIEMKYGYKKFPSKIDKIERKGEMIKFKTSKSEDTED